MGDEGKPKSAVEAALQALRQGWAAPGSQPGGSPPPPPAGQAQGGAAELLLRRAKEVAALQGPLPVAPPPAPHPAPSPRPAPPLASPVPPPIASPPPPPAQAVPAPAPADSTRNHPLPSPPAGGSRLTQPAGPRRRSHADRAAMSALPRAAGAGPVSKRRISAPLPLAPVRAPVPAPAPAPVPVPAPSPEPPPAPRRSSPSLSPWLEATSLAVVVEELIGQDTCLGSQLETAADHEALFAFLARHTGLDRAFCQACRPAALALGHQPTAFALAAWLLCTEFVGDLGRVPRHPSLLPIASLPEATARVCTGLLASLRARHPARYIRWADDVEKALLADELAEFHAGELGRVDTFRAEQRRVLDAAVEQLLRGEWTRARDWARAREGRASFWLEHEKHYRSEWSLLALAAGVLEAIDLCPRPLALARSLQEAADLYASAALPVDRALRRFEQARAQLLDRRQPHFVELRDGVTRTIRERHRAWAAQLSVDFSALADAPGAGPSPELQHRTLFEHVVSPMLSRREPVAVVVLAALGLEMAAELLDDGALEGSSARLLPRLADRPTVALTAKNLAARAERAGHAARVVSLDEVSNDDPGSLSARLPGPGGSLLVLGPELDGSRAGAAALEQDVRDLREAIGNLRAAGVEHLLITAAQGVLLTEAAGAGQPASRRGAALLRGGSSPQERLVPALLVTPSPLSLSPLAHVPPDELPVDEAPATLRAGEALATPKGEAAWYEQIDDAGVRAVLMHLDKYGSISEPEATKMLGSPQRFRKFSREVDEHARKAPFRIVARQGADGKRYEKDKDG